MAEARRFPYHRKPAAILAIFLAAVDVFLAAVIYVTSQNWLIALAIGVLFFLVDLVFAISPLLTKHEVGDGFIIIRQGWYFKKRMDLKDITLIHKVRRGPFSYGMHWMFDATRYVNGSRDDLILVVEHGGDRRSEYRLLFDVLDRDGFLWAMGQDPSKVPEVASMDLSGREK